MKTGIIGLPQVGKTSLFGILTKARLSEQAYANPREAHIGVARCPTTASTAWPRSMTPRS